MVNVFGGTKRGPEGPPGERGPPGKKGRDALNLIKWFPTLILRELRQHVNRTSLLIENKDVDVTLDKNQVVKSWHSRSKKYPCSFTGYGGKLVDSSVTHQWGLLFDSKAMYQTNYELLSVGLYTCLTMTFSCENTKDRQYIINDYIPKRPFFRGISIHQNKMCLHGEKDNKEITICDIEEENYYTIQILWKNYEHKEESWFTVYQDATIQVPKTNFTSNKLSSIVTQPVLSLGALDAVSGPSNYFSGIITNVDILLTKFEPPQEILTFVIESQFM